MTIPTLTTLPVAPARTDPPATFVTRADAFLAAIVTFQGEMNTSIGAMNTDIAGVNADATAAAASATAAASSATAAANSAGAALWVSGQSYAEGDAAISGVNYQTYRAETATSGTTDPSLDANWTAISGTFPVQTGNAGKFLTTDGTDTSWAAVSAGKVTRTAAAAITAGEPVSIQSDGTVKPTSGLEQAESTGPDAEWEATQGLSNWFSTAYNTASNKGVINWSENLDGNLYSRVITNTSGTLTFGTKTNTSNVQQTASVCVYNEDQDVFVFVYHETLTSTLKAVAASVVGTVLSYGTPVTVKSSTSRDRVGLESTNGAEVLVVTSFAPDLEAITITCSGTTLTVNTPVTKVISGEDVHAHLSKNTSDGSFACSFRLNSNPGIIKITVSGTVPSFGTEQELASATMDYVQTVYNAEYDRYIYSYMDQSGTDNFPVFMILSESGGTFTVLDTASPENITTTVNSVWVPMSYDSANYIVLASTYQTSSASNASYSVIIDGDVLQFGTPTNFSDAAGTNRRFVHYYDPDEAEFVVSYNGDDSDGHSNTLTPQASWSSRNAYFGIADADIANGASGNITIVSGVNNSVTGLSSGDFYYLTSIGNLTTTSNGYPVGHALSSTSIILDNVGYNSLPSQSGNATKVLTTDGSSSSWSALEKVTLVGAIDAGGLVLTNTNSNALISFSHKSLVDKNPSGYAGVGRQDGADYTQVTGPQNAIYSSYYKQWFASGQGWGGQTGTNDLSLWSSVDGINWSVYMSFRMLLGTSWSGNLQARNNYDPPFAIDNSNGRIWVMGTGPNTSTMRMGYFDPSSGARQGTLVDISVASGNSNPVIVWMECIEPANIILICLENNNLQPKFAYIAAGGTTPVYLGLRSNASQSKDKWRFCWNYEEATSTYRIAMLVGDATQTYWTQSTNPASLPNGPTNYSGTSYDQEMQISMSDTHLMFTKDSHVYARAFEGNVWRSGTGWTQYNNPFGSNSSPKAMNYNPVDGYNYTITSQGQVFRFTAPTTSAECIGTTGFQIAVQGDARIKFRGN